ncbi:MAG: hypothetical protein IKJ83_01755 [Ruminococcus sp.]|nr:hypothetical protein [Ruminococcus sp.]
MKKYLALLMTLLMILSLAACTSEQAKTDSTEPAKIEDIYLKNDYVLSEEVPEGSIVDGVMTDISGADPILKKTVAEWLDTCVLYEVNIRQYTEEGTFKAFESHLERLKNMGINTLWFMPIHPISETERKGTLGSYYAVDDYMKVNPEFGTMEDFVHLVDTAHEMGFKIILDWVANHTGWDNQWIKDHDDWFEHDKNGEITYPFDWSDVAELNFDNYEMRAEMIKCMQFWVEEVGIDGFRCDHASGVPATFWNAAVYKLKSINSEILMLAEVAGTEALTCYAFDSCYNDNLYNQSLMVQAGVGTEALGNALHLDRHYPAGSFPMNYTDNHDKNSYEGTIYDRFDSAYEAMFALSYIAPGMPLVYTANEQGYDHEIEFFEKDTIVWEESPVYEEFITELSMLKAQEKALASTNSNVEIIETSNPQFLAFSRTMGDSKVYYIANLYYEALSDVTFSFDIDKAECVIHYDGESFDFEDKEFTLSDLNTKEFAPYEFYIFTVNS